MATLQRIRNKGGLLISIVIGLALVAFIAGDALSSGSSIFNSRTKAGEIAGETVSIMDYQARLSEEEELFKMNNNIPALNDEQQYSLRENVWQQMVMQAVVNREYEELGIEVGSDELYELLLGSNMHPGIRQMFGNADVESIRQYVRSLMSYPDNNPQKMFWLKVEQDVTEMRKQEKYNALLQKGLFVTNAEAEATLANEAVKVDLSYVAKKYISLPDSTISVSSSEISDYYKNHTKLFQQSESRKISYVTFNIVPSSTDLADTRKWISDLRTEFAEAENPMEFVNLTSDEKFDATFYSRKEISNDSLADFIFNEKGVFGPYIENNAVRISRCSETRMLPDSVRARHILITPNDNNIAAARALADSLAGVLKKGGDFDALARTYSADNASGVNGGDLGWFNDKTMVAPFSEAVFSSKLKEIKVVETQFGFHIVQLLDRTKPLQKVQIATVMKEIAPSQTTINKMFNEASSFARNVKDVESFNTQVKEKGLVRKVGALNKNDRNLAGAGEARELVRNTYLTSNVGSVILNNEKTNIFDLDNKFIVAVLTEINEEGVSPLNAVSGKIRQELVRKKKAEILTKEFENAGAPNQGLSIVAQKMNLQVKNASAVSFNSFQIPGEGIEPNVIAAAVQLDKGKTSAPIMGTQGVYLIQVNEKKTEPIASDMIANTRVSMQQGYAYKASQAYVALQQNADVVDLRYKFY